MSDIDATSATSAAGDQANPAAALGDKNTVGLKKVKKQKVLLMGKSGSGKSSMRSIIFSNYLARDTRRLGATIDIDLSHVKFLGNLTLNLWDCGGQEAFMENYLSQQRAHVFSNVGVLIYVFDIESRDVDRDLATYVNIASALFQYSREAKVFVLLHKMDLIQPSTREAVFDNRVTVIRKKTAEAIAIVRKQKPDMAAGASALAAVDLEMQAFATSIWDQSLYKAWASIIHDLVPNLSLIEQQLASLGVAIDAEEILLFERTSFLVVSKWSSTEGERNPFGDRFERLSNILKSWKHTCSKFTGTPRNAEQFTDFEYKAGANFALFITKFTTNTYILVCMPPGEARFNSAKLNVSIARSWFRFLDGPPTATVAASPASSGNSQQIAAGAAAGASGAAADYNAAGPSSEA
ncbi:Gtr1/RagA G protein conserved region-domain-containing protein [Phialemonium atrogriseum]|uniref:GTP-binding protein n=1 Tax=Phialemonium atrogriseum TaxID=1093897 RepID=A0AAJ0FL41_9PEZI|nr:Gtr1/RagA G protein conserved region-domain-containing protein [Phialemonium atrogriseum]KAK1766274.1 Gtr1/RagA G protein conserved region-domain-containing protein [Phialemonium atrogriseum]